jgi:hypothetical protein
MTTAPETGEITTATETDEMTAPAETQEDHLMAQEDDRDTPEGPAFGPVAMPADTAEDHQMVPDDDRDMPEGFNVDPAGVIMAGDPQSPDPAASEQSAARATDSAEAEPGVADGADAEGPSVVAAPGAEPVPAQVSPAAGDGTTSDARWHEILAMFVDDPRSSIELAAGLVDESAQALVISVKERQHVLLSAWQGDDAGTEEIRVTLQSYRALWHRLEDFSREA